MKPSTKISNETKALIDWLETYESLNGWLTEDLISLQEMAVELFYSGLNSRSISDTLQEILSNVVKERINWDYVLEWRNKKKKKINTISLVRN